MFTSSKDILGWSPKNQRTKDEDNFYTKKIWVLFWCARPKEKAEAINHIKSKSHCLLPSTYYYYYYCSILTRFRIFTELRDHSYYSAVMSPKHCVVISGFLFLSEVLLSFFWIPLEIREKGILFLFLMNSVVKHVWLEERQWKRREKHTNKLVGWEILKKFHLYEFLKSNYWILYTLFS